MTSYAFPTRRMLLRDMGKAGLAVVVLGSAACSTESSDNATPTPETTGAASPTSPAGETSSSSSTSAAESTAPPATSPAEGYRWQRVHLGFVSAYILFRGTEATVVDTGVSDSEGAIEAALGEIGLGWDMVGAAIVTHRHPDHQGGLAGVLAATEAPWYAGAGDIPAITVSTEGIPVGDGNRVDGLDIIETPGHTAGHISVLDPAAGILVAGDALTGTGGGIAGSNPDFTEDIQLANASVAKLAGFDYEVVLFGHGEPIHEAGSTMVEELAQTSG